MNRTYLVLFAIPAIAQVNRMARMPENAQLSRVPLAAQQALAQNTIKPIIAHLQKKGREPSLNGLRWGKHRCFSESRRAPAQDVNVQLLAGSQLPEVTGESAVLTSELTLSLLRLVAL